MSGGRADGKQADVVTMGGGAGFWHPQLRDDMLEDAEPEKSKYDKYLDPYARFGGFAFVPQASTSIGQLGADLLRVLWVCAIFLAVTRSWADAEGV